MKILFIGPPGSGKGTQARMVAEKLGIPFISAGDIIRDEIAMMAELGGKAERYVKNGELVPDKVVIDMLLANLPQSFVLEGFPRNVLQAILLEKIKPDYVFYLYLESPDIIQRISKRKVCPNCKTVYNLSSNPPKTPDICDICGSKLTSRVDDAEETIKKRIDVYENETYPLINYYRKREKLIRIDGSGSIEEVHDRIMQAVKGIKGTGRKELGLNSGFAGLWLKKKV